MLEGTLTLLIEGDEPRELRRGDLARVAPDVRRQLVNRHPELAAHPGGGRRRSRTSGRDGRAWESWDEGGEGRPPQEVDLPDDVPRRASARPPPCRPRRSARPPPRRAGTARRACAAGRR